MSEDGRSVFATALALALGAAVSLGLARFSYALLLPTMRADLGWSCFTAGAMNTLIAVGYLVGALLLPRALARIDARSFFLAGGWGTALVLAAHGLVRSDAALYALRGLAGVASAATFATGGLLAARLGQRPGAKHPQDLEMPPAPVLPPGPWVTTVSASMTAWSGPWGTSFTANLTPDPETGLGRWTDESFIATIRNARHMGVGRPLLPPMPAAMIANYTDEDLRAIFAYLRSIPPVRNRVPRRVKADRPALNLNVAFFVFVQSSQHVHQRAFARAVFAQQRVDLALPQRKVNVIVRQHAGKTLDDPAHLYSVLNTIICAMNDLATVGGSFAGPATSPLLITPLFRPRTLTPMLSPGYRLINHFMVHFNGFNFSRNPARFHTRFKD